MSIKVIRYKNYGCTMTGDEDSGDLKEKFYWSFYELSNRKIIYLNYTETFEKNKFLDNEFAYYYANYELKTGESRTYKFGNAKANNEEQMSKEFFEWFESQPPYHQIKNLTYPTKEEEKCVEEFFKKHLEKDKRTNTLWETGWVD